MLKTNEDKLVKISVIGEAARAGIVVHTDCVTAGHGPGVTTLFTSSTGKIIPRIDEKANVATILTLRKVQAA